MTNSAKIAKKNKSNKNQDLQSKAFRENGTHYKITGQERIPVKITISIRENSDARVFLAPFLC